MEESRDRIRTETDFPGEVRFQRKIYALSPGAEMGNLLQRISLDPRPLGACAGVSNIYLFYIPFSIG